MNKKIKLIPFVVVGDPSLDKSGELLRKFATNGYDTAVLGIPFSDPVMESLVVQEANTRAIEKGVRTDNIFALLKELNLPINYILRTYANVVFSIGIKNFAIEAKKAGVKALFITDLPFVERDEFVQALKDEGIDLLNNIVLSDESKIEMMVDAQENLLISPDFEGDNELEQLKTLSLMVDKYNLNVNKMIEYNPKFKLKDYQGIADSLIINLMQ